LALLLALANIASLIWIFVDFAALGSATSSLDSNNLYLQIGRRVQARIPIASVQQAILLSWRETPPSGKDSLNATVPAEPNVLLTFHEPVSVRLFGKSESHSMKIDLGLQLPKLQAGRLYFLAPTMVP
jgi:hypothetical protein